MENKWAMDNLQTIRILMERSAVYRRALAPICMFVGTTGIVAAFAGWKMGFDEAGPFAAFWMTIAVIALGGSLLLVRRQAAGQGENFWSPPMRRVAEAMFPSLTIGLLAGVFVMLKFWGLGSMVMYILVIGWTLLFALAVYAAGFFMPRGVKWFGLGLMSAGLILPTIIFQDQFLNAGFSPHLLMGVVFGLTHLAYGSYLYFTETRKD